MIKAKQAFFLTSESEVYGFHHNKAIILYLTKKYYSLSVLSVKLYFIAIGPIPANKTNDLILNLTPENVTQHSRIE